MISTMIADDEKHSRERIKKLLLNHNEFDIKFEAKNGDDVLKYLVSNDIQVVFLDINMPGVSVFKTISSLNKKPIIIFQTAYSEHAAAAFDIEALDYLLKPISEERLLKTVTKINKKLKENNFAVEEPKRDKNEKVQNISVKTGNIIKIIPVETIYKISFEEGFSFIYTEDGRFLSDKYLNYFDELLSNNSFYRASRTDLINIYFINKIHTMFKGNYLIELINNEKVKLSRRRYKGLKDIINI